MSFIVESEKNKDIAKITEALLDYIESLPNGKEISTSEVFVKVFGTECFLKRSCSFGEYLIENINFYSMSLKRNS